MKWQLENLVTRSSHLPLFPQQDTNSKLCGSIKAVDYVLRTKGQKSDAQQDLTFITEK